MGRPGAQRFAVGSNKRHLKIARVAGRFFEAPDERFLGKDERSATWTADKIAREPMGKQSLQKLPRRGICRSECDREMLTIVLLQNRQKRKDLRREIGGRRTGIANVAIDKRR